MITKFQLILNLLLYSVVIMYISTKIEKLQQYPIINDKLLSLGTGALAVVGILNMRTHILTATAASRHLHIYVYELCAL